MENPGKVGISFKNERHHFIQVHSILSGDNVRFFFFFRGSSTCIVKTKRQRGVITSCENASLLEKLYD